MLKFGNLYNNFEHPITALSVVSRQGGRRAKKARQAIMKLDKVQCEGSASVFVRRPT